MAPPDDLIGTSEAAAILNLSEGKVRSLARACEVPSVTTTAGRLQFRRKDVEAALPLADDHRRASQRSANTARTLSVSEAARVVGVSAGTLRRWVDDGLLAATRTPGGHRRIRPEVLSPVLGHVGTRHDPGRPAGQKVDESFPDADGTYRGIGEFVVFFSWVEQMYRQIGWFILDPERRAWPPMKLRKETPRQLIEKVSAMFAELTATYAFPSGEEQAASFSELEEIFVGLSIFRNRLLHSSYVEMKAGGELIGHLRVNPAFGVDPDSGELIRDVEHFSAKVVRAKMEEVAWPAVRLGQHHMQLIHWAPFERHGLVEAPRRP